MLGGVLDDAEAEHSTVDPADNGLSEYDMGENVLYFYKHMDTALALQTVWRQCHRMIVNTYLCRLSLPKKILAAKLESMW